MKAARPLSRVVSPVAHCSGGGEEGGGRVGRGVVSLPRVRARGSYASDVLSDLGNDGVS